MFLNFKSLYPFSSSGFLGIGSRNPYFISKGTPPLSLQNLSFIFHLLKPKPLEITTMAVQSSPMTPKSTANPSISPSAPSECHRSRISSSSTRIFEPVVLAEPFSPTACRLEGIALGRPVYWEVDRPYIGVERRHILQGPSPRPQGQNPLCIPVHTHILKGLYLQGR